MTKIEWTDETWNPIGALDTETMTFGWHCEHVSEGCRNCYSERMNRWRGTRLEYKPGYVNGRLEMQLYPGTLRKPLTWKRPRRIFVCSMTDLFADFVPDHWIDQIFAVMGLSPQHTFQVLTKRPARMHRYLADERTAGRIGDIAFELMDGLPPIAINAPTLRGQIGKGLNGWGIWPLPNIWLGVSAEDQAAADERVPLLFDTPAAKRFLSAEPLLGPIDLALCLSIHGAAWRWLNWMIVGGESGPGARPMHPDWARVLRDQCEEAAIPFFFKQWGEWSPDGGPEPDGRDPIMEGKARCAWLDGDVWRYEPNAYAVDLDISRGSGEWMYRLGKKHAGALLDGREHKEWPR